MDISFVILTWNSSGYLRKCFRSLMRVLSDSSYSYEIFVVDNGSTDDSAKIIDEFCREDNSIHLIQLEQNIGTTKSRNIALRRCRGEYICILDSDIEFEGNVFPDLLQVLSRSDDIGMVVPQLIYPSGKWQKSVDRFPTLPHKIRRFFFLRQIEAGEWAEVGNNGFSCEKTVDYAISAFWLLKRDVLEKIGLLDEKIFYAPEDVDFCLRVWKGGNSIVYVPSRRAIHHTQEISRGMNLNKAKMEHIKGLFYFFVKHKYLFRAPCFLK
ncbi:glycosyltransferase family 2 protein [Pelobacter seleniigenes]|uniref:glycosyltransferase family 2 protein n=1 Tax=Pelobacter seleniigenes TaxID=407188 RepID=UPI0004A70DDE|nr:glycosyltransferase family 2 protein [Pelobacter seleniigenes]